MAIKPFALCFGRGQSILEHYTVKVTPALSTNNTSTLAYVAPPSVMNKTFYSIVIAIKLFWLFARGGPKYAKAFFSWVDSSLMHK
jgi:hypothetical protein